MRGPRISVVIPVRNGATTLGRCLEALRSAASAGVEIVVVDDVSSDGSADIALCHGARVVAVDRPVGPSAARNLGARSATGDVLFFVDADVIVPRDSLDRLRDLFADPAVVAATGLFADTTAYDNLCTQYKNLWMHYTYGRLPDEVAVFYTSSAAIRRDVFLAIGGFDEHYRTASVEDTDFGHRLLDHGYAVRLQRGLAVVHAKRYGLRDVLRTDFHRSAALVRMTLRRGVRRLFGANRSSVPSSFVMSLVVLGGMMVAAGLMAIAVHPLALLMIPVSAVCFLAVNVGFLNWLRRKRNVGFALRAGLLLTLDGLAALAGIAAGSITYAFGRRY